MPPWSWPHLSPAGHDLTCAPAPPLPVPLQAVTFCVSLLHTVFDMLAFKNDIGFWKNNKSMEGLSARTVLINAVGGGGGALGGIGFQKVLRGAVCTTPSSPIHGEGRGVKGGREGGGREGGRAASAALCIYCARQCVRDTMTGGVGGGGGYTEVVRGQNMTDVELWTAASTVPPVRGRPSSHC